MKYLPKPGPDAALYYLSLRNPELLTQGNPVPVLFDCPKQGQALRNRPQPQLCRRVKALAIFHLAHV